MLIKDACFFILRSTIAIVVFVGVLFYWLPFENLITNLYKSLVTETSFNVFIDKCKVRHVIISGNKIVPSADLKNLVSEKESLFSISALGIASAIKYISPVVKSVSVVKEWPNTIRIYIEEYKPFALLCYSTDSCSIVDKNAHIISDSKYFKKLHLVKLFILKITKEDISFVDSIINNSSTLAGTIDSFYKVGYRRFDIVFRNGLKLKLPQDKALMAWFTFVVMNPSFKDKWKVIDMRLPDRVFLKKKK